MKRLFGYITFLLLTTHLLGQDGTWTEVQGMPGPRIEHAAAAIDDQIYLSGGRQAHGGMHGAESQLWSYNTQSGTWTSDLPAMPQPREEHSMLAIGDTLIVFGGRDHENIIADVIFWVQGSDSWDVLTTMPLPRKGMGTFIRSGLVYLAGGKTSNNMWATPVDQVDIFNPTNGSWELGNSLNQGRVDFAVISYGDTAYCVGGRYLDPIASTEVLIGENVWSPGQPLQFARSSSAGTYFEGELVILGGITANGLAQTNLLFNGVEWEDFEPNLLPRHDLTAVQAGGNIFVLGGRNGNQILNSVEKFTSTVSIDDDWTQPGSPALLRAYPNPFNGEVSLTFEGPDAPSSDMIISVYDIQGHLVYSRSIERAMNGRLRLRSSDLRGSGSYVVKIEYIDESSRPHSLTTKVNLIY